MNDDYDGQPDATGTLFVDILFALVVTQILLPLKDPSRTSWTGGIHLTVAFVVTLLSWIGYHNSKARADAPLRFPTSRRLNAVFGKPKPEKWHYFSFAQFLLDVAMVVVYWMMSITYERSTADVEVAGDLFWYWPSKPSAFPEALGVVLAMTLYAAWDWVGVREATWLVKYRSGQVNGGPPEATALALSSAQKSLVRRERRRKPTWVALTIAAALLLASFGLRGQGAVLVLDGLLIALLIGYRYHKEMIGADLDL